MFFDKVFQKKQEVYLAVNLFTKNCNLALFLINEAGVDILHSDYYSFSQGESFSQVLSQFLQKAGSGKDIKVVFGLPSFWIEGEQVRPEFEKRLLSAANELGLQPTAFVSSTVAFGFYKFQKQPNLKIFLVLSLFDKKILVEKFENGEVVKSASFDFEEVEDLPLSEIFQDEKVLPIFVWSEKPDFEKISNGIKKFFEEKEITEPEILPIELSEFAQSLATATAYDLGKLDTEKDFKRSESLPQKETVADFGFLKEKDVLQFEEGEKDQVLKVETQSKRLPNLSNLFLKFSPTLAKIFRSKKRLAVLISLTFLLIGFGVFWFLPAASIEIFVKSQPLSQNFDIKASPTVAASDYQNLVIGAQVLETTKEGSKKTVTTGRKKMGEKAQGEVTIFNKTTSSKTFSTGTQILGPGNVKFVLEDQVTVASRSASLEGITYGKGKVKVRAVEIGEEGNLPAGTDFTLADFDSSQYSAHSEEAFTGGVSKEINIVAEDDKLRLEQELLKELREQAKSELTRLAAGKVLEDGAIIETAQKKEFDKNTGEEANILQLQGRINFKATVFSVSDIEQVISENLKQAGTEFQNLQNTKIDTTVAKAETDGTLRLKVKFEADLIPNLNKEEIAQAVSGKSVDFAKNYLFAIPEVEDIDIKLSPRLPFLGTMPRAKSRIKIEVKAQKD